MNLIFSFGLCIGLAVLTIAQTDGHSEYDKHNMKDCRRIGKNMGLSVLNSMCKPHPRLVDLKPERGYRFSPSRVSVKRCDGNCFTGLSCGPTETRKTEVHVQLRDSSKGMAKCAAVEVEEHVRCRCMCEKTARDCNVRQMYNEKTCKCMCKEENEKQMECENKKEMTWDRDDCSCKCMKMLTQCSTGFEWNEEECECRRMAKK